MTPLRNISGKDWGLKFDEALGAERNLHRCPASEGILTVKSEA